MQKLCPATCGVCPEGSEEKTWPPPPGEFSLGPKEIALVYGEFLGTCKSKVLIVFS